jgi:2-hydroxy-4-carboxymuconate semialdehyde hemiacetal dehydrogenase
MKAGKHVQVEIPLCDKLAEAARRCRGAEEDRAGGMVGHTRRFNPSHQYVHKKIKAGEFNIQQMDVQTYFFRRTNMNALGQARSWTDHLLWHHAAHTVDLFAYQTGSKDREGQCGAGPDPPGAGHRDGHEHPAEGESGAICTLSLSFNNDGPLGTFFRYIGDTAHLHRALRRPVQRQGREDRRVSKVDVSMNGIELQDREFIAAIREGREPKLGRPLDCYRVLGDLEKQLAGA